MQTATNAYQTWLAFAPELTDALTHMTDTEREDAFWRTLAFGTGGLRGILGAGTNRMNRYTVAQASQGLADYVRQNGGGSIAVSYDSRHGSLAFARTAAEVFAANGLSVRIVRELMPTPCLSFAVRTLGCAAGIMITASHNPAEYNGYKVYGADGCQITTEAAERIQQAIDATDLFDGVRAVDFDSALADGKISYIPDTLLDDFIRAVQAQSVLFGDPVDRNFSIVYTPLNGTGRKPVLRVLRESGFRNVSVVAEQELPDGDFPTCPYPNPECREAMALGLRDAKARNADLLLATDPDCDRVGIAVRDGAEYRLLTGNEVGLLLTDFICSQRQKHRKLPPHPVLVKTIVTTDLAEKIAAHYGVETVNVLTGFKFIGEKIGDLERQGRADDFLLGFEESYGYLTGSYVRDKDGVNGVFQIAEMAGYYRAQGIGLAEKLRELYDTYGYCRNTLHTKTFAGEAGQDAMARVMATLRRMTAIGDYPILSRTDYRNGVDGLPKSDVLKLTLPVGTVIVRPSGTEPKLKLYLSVSAKDTTEAERTENRLMKTLSEEIGIG